MEEISVREFKTALEIVKPGVSTKETTMEQVTSFAFTGKNVISYNDEICLQHPLEVSVKGAIKAEVLYQFLSKIKTEVIKVETSDDQILFKSGRAKVGFNLDSEIKLPLDDEKLTEKGKWKEIPENFLEAIAMAANSTSKDTSDPKLICVHINKKGFVEGSDNNRIIRYDLGQKLPINTALVPSSSISAILRIKATHVAKGNEWIHFKNERNTILSCRVLNEDFVDTKPFLRTKKKGTEITFPEELLEVLSTAEIFINPNKANKDVTISLKKKKMQISVEAETAWFQDELEMETKVDSFAFQITPYLLKDILKQANTCTIFNDRLLFKGDNWKYVTALSEIEE